MIQARNIIQHTVLPFAHRLVVGAHQVDVLERPPGVTLPERTEQCIRFATRHASQVGRTARIRQTQAVATLTRRPMSRFLRVLDRHDSAGIELGFHGTFHRRFP